MKTIKVIIKESNANPYTKLISNDIENLQKFLWEMWKLAVGLQMISS